MTSALDMFYQRRWLAFGTLAILTALLLLRELGNPALGYPDADRLLMDGVFLLDFLRALPFDRVIEFTKAYYAQYPALSIGYRPPFFPFIEALFNAVFGINTWSSRLAILAFALPGLAAWYALVARIYTREVAFWACALLITTPFLVQWGWYTMGEIPLLAMAMMTLYFFYRFSETQAAKYIYLTAIFFCLTAWTKQTAVYLAAFFFFYLLYRRQLLSFLRSRQSWIAIAIAALLLLPLAAITLWLGDLNVQQSVGSTEASGTPSRLSVANWLAHWHSLTAYHFNWPTLALSAVGLLLALYKRDDRAVFFALLILVTYLFFSLLAGKNPRYPFFWMPAFTVFAALALVYFKQPLARVLWTIALLAVVSFNVYESWRKQPQYATGYDTAARFVLEHSKSPTVFFDGYNNGYFTYFMRAADPAQTMYVLRGDKLLTSSAINNNIWLEVHARDEADIERMLKEYGIELVVLESRDVSGIPIHQKLRTLVTGDRFELLARIPVESNREPLQAQTLDIYRYRHAQAMTASHLTLKLPVVGQTIQVPMRAATGSARGTQPSSNQAVTP